VLSPGSAETNFGWGGKLNGHLMASCGKNIYTKNYHNLVIGFQVIVKNVGDVFWDTVYTWYRNSGDDTLFLFSYRTYLHYIKFNLFVFICYSNKCTKLALIQNSHVKTVGQILVT